MEDWQEAKENDEQCNQAEYNWVKSLLFTYSDAVVPRDNYYFIMNDEGTSWILMIKKGVKLIPKDVYSGLMKGFVFYFKDDMTPRPFDE